MRSARRVALRLLPTATTGQRRRSRLMRRIDELFTAWPFLGSRGMAAMLRADGWPINRKRVQRLMRRMGIAALGPKPNTSKPAPGHKIYPYLLRGLAIERVNQVWAADMTGGPLSSCQRMLRACGPPVDRLKVSSIPVDRSGERDEP